MKQMMFALIALAVTMGVPALAAAEDDDGPGGPPKGAMKKFRAMRIAEMQESLNLDDKTTIKLNDILKKFDESRDKLHHDLRAGMKELKGLMDAQKPDEAKIAPLLDKLITGREKMHDLQTEQMKEVRRILSPTQQAKFVLHMAKFKKHMREMIKKSWMRHGGGPGGPGPHGPGPGGPGGPGVGLGMGPGPDMPPPPEDDDDDL